MSLLIKSQSAETVCLARAHLGSIDHRDVFLTVHQCIMVCGWNARLNQEVFDCSSLTALHFLMSDTKADLFVFLCSFVNVSNLLWVDATDSLRTGSVYGKVIHVHAFVFLCVKQLWLSISAGEPVPITHF